MISEKFKREIEENTLQAQIEINSLDRKKKALDSIKDYQNQLEEIDKEIEKKKEENDGKIEETDELEIKRAKNIEELKKLERFLQGEYGNQKKIINSVDVTTKEVNYLSDKIELLKNSLSKKKNFEGKYFRIFL